MDVASELGFNTRRLRFATQKRWQSGRRLSGDTIASDWPYHRITSPWGQMGRVGRIILRRLQAAAPWVRAPEHRENRRLSDSSPLPGLAFAATLLLQYPLGSELAYDWDDDNRDHIARRQVARGLNRSSRMIHSRYWRWDRGARARVRATWLYPF